jgi:hypothetical protein
MRCAAYLLGALSASASAGCGFGEGDAKVPGDDLGKFHVVGELDASSCGQGALGSSDVWEFELRLSRSPYALYWLNGREVIEGKIADDGVSFEILTRLEVPVLDPEPGFTGCVLERNDRAVGKLGSETTEVKHFSGRLSYEYRAFGESDCTPLMGVQGGFDALPCELSYDLDGARVQSPEDLRTER